MKFQKLVFTFLIFCFAYQICFAQITQDEIERNWNKDTKGYDNPYSAYDFKFYTKNDVDNAIKRFHIIKDNSLNNDEWEGIYSSGSMLGYNELFWSSSNGFVESYVYHTLVSINYGFAEDDTDSVKLISEISSPIKTLRKLIKIKFGDRHYLVPENTIEDFSKKAVGLTNEYSEDTDYYCKVEDEKKKIYGIPKLPNKYKKFEYHPVKARIIKVAKLKLNQNKSGDGTVFSEYFSYEIILNVGRDKGIKKDFQFYIEEINEIVTIDKISSQTSTAEVIRYLDKNGQETCHETESLDSKLVPCLVVRIGLNATSQIGGYF